jgi:hypothetical protein
LPLVIRLHGGGGGAAGRNRRHAADGGAKAGRRLLRLLEVPTTPVFRSRALAPVLVPLVAVPLVELASAALPPVVLPLAAPAPETPLVPAGPVEEALPV